jgi:hypothetical protein
MAYAAVSGGVVGPNVNVTALPFSQFGVALAADPTNPDTLVLAALDGSESRPGALRALSRDGGASWTTVRGLPGNFGGFSPAVAFDAFGNCFLALIHDPGFGSPRLDLFLSTDGGATFATLPLPELPNLETSASVSAGFGSVWVAFESFGDGIRTLAAPVTGRGQIGAFALQTLPGASDGRRPTWPFGRAGRRWSRTGTASSARRRPSASKSTRMDSARRASASACRSPTFRAIPICPARRSASIPPAVGSTSPIRLAGGRRARRGACQLQR